MQSEKDASVLRSHPFRSPDEVAVRALALHSSSSQRSVAAEAFRGGYDLKTFRQTHKLAG